MFLAMLLQNARRKEARGLMLTVDRSIARIDMLLVDGSSLPLTPPPAEILMKIIENLERGERSFCSNVFDVTIEQVTVQRGVDNIVAHISDWSIEHAE
jgi:hypothetical protein